MYYVDLQTLYSYVINYSWAVVCTEFKLEKGFVSQELCVMSCVLEYFVFGRARPDISYIKPAEKLISSCI